MSADSSSEAPASKRAWVVLLYFYLAALVGLGFVISGTTVALFGAKDAAFPGLNVPRYSYEYDRPYYQEESGEAREPTEQELAEAKQRAIEDRRTSGLDSMINGLIITGVGTPVLIWHYRRARALSTAPHP